MIVSPSDAISYRASKSATRSAVPTRGRGLGAAFIRTDRATLTAISGLSELDASDSADRRVARILCLVAGPAGRSPGDGLADSRVIVFAGCEDAGVLLVDKVHGRGEVGGPELVQRHVTEGWQEHAPDVGLVAADCVAGDVLGAASFGQPAEQVLAGRGLLGSRCRAGSGGGCRRSQAVMPCTWWRRGSSPGSPAGQCRRRARSPGST